MLATVGFILVIVMVALIIWGKVALPPILILLSTAAVIVLSLTGALPDVVGPLAILDALKGYIGTGANSVLNTVVLFTFAIVYFNVLSDAGMFDMIVGAVMKRMGNHVSAILLMTCFLAFISHLDGSGAASSGGNASSWQTTPLRPARTKSVSRKGAIFCVQKKYAPSSVGKISPSISRRIPRCISAPSTSRCVRSGTKPRPVSTACRHAIGNGSGG